MPLNRALFSSDVEHWLTPPWFTDIVLKTHGVIDFDPATNRASQVPANDHAYVDEFDGLLAPWLGHMYINPPYGVKIPVWVEMMHLAMRVTQSAKSIHALIPARVDTSWCQQHVMASADAWCFWSGRITFWRTWEVKALQKRLRFISDQLPAPFRLIEDGVAVGPDLDKFGKPSPAPFPSMVPYWGPDALTFAKTFRPYGAITIARGPKRGFYPAKAA